MHAKNMEPVLCWPTSPGHRSYPGYSEWHSVRENKLSKQLSIANSFLRTLIFNKKCKGSCYIVKCFSKSWKLCLGVKELWENDDQDKGGRYYSSEWILVSGRWEEGRKWGDISSFPPTIHTQIDAALMRSVVRHLRKHSCKLHLMPQKQMCSSGLGIKAF